MLNKIILHTIELYLDTSIKQEKETYQRDKILNVLTKLKGYKMFHKFDKEEHKHLVELGKTDTLESIKKIEVDFSVYAIYLLKEWIENIPKKDRPQINLSDKKIKDLEASLIKDKLSLKRRDTKDYNDVSEIVEQSKMAAKRYFHFFDNELGRVA